MLFVKAEFRSRYTSRRIDEAIYAADTAAKLPGVMVAIVLKVKQEFAGARERE